MPFADIGDVRLFFTDEGTGDPPMLFVHGFACDSHDWSWQLPFFGERHRTIAVDLRGHGRSCVPETGFDVRQLAADLAGLLEQLGIGPVVDVGHSLGALVVSALAVEHPAHVLREMHRAAVEGPDALAIGAASVAYLPRRGCPVLAVHAAPGQAAIEQTLFADERSKAVAWEGSGHWLHQERPAELDHLVAGWLADLLPV